MPLDECRPVLRGLDQEVDDATLRSHGLEVIFRLEQAGLIVIRSRGGRPSPRRLRSRRAWRPFPPRWHRRVTLEATEAGRARVESRRRWALYGFDIETELLDLRLDLDDLTDDDARAHLHTDVTDPHLQDVYLIPDEHLDWWQHRTGIDIRSHRWHFSVEKVGGLEP